MNIGTYFGYNSNIDYKHLCIRKKAPHMKRHLLATMQVEVPCQNIAHPSLEPKSLKCLISTSKYGKQIHPQIVKMVNRLL